MEKKGRRIAEQINLDQPQNPSGDASDLYSTYTMNPVGLSSLFSYNPNKTVNIYTHLLGAHLFLALLPWTPQLLHRYPTATASDITAFSTFLLSAVTCLGLSATYHTISNHSHRIAKFGNQLDYLGIIILVVGSYLPTVHYGFHQCHPSLGRIYSAMMLLHGAACTVVTLKPRFRTPTYRPFRAGMFVLLGVSGMIPVVHGMRLYGGAAVLDARIGLRWVLAEGAMYILGAGIYAARVPERWVPGRFDLVGASHQIFHCFVVAAAVAHLKGLVVAFDFLHEKGGGKC